MHWQAYSFVQLVKSIYPQYFRFTNISEFGSASVNYSVRNLFQSPKKYIGIDLCENKTVDLIVNGKNVFLGQDFDVVLSCECFEHNPYYLETFENMIRHARSGGLVIFTCASTGRAEHGTKKTDPRQSPGTTEMGWEYYLNLEQSHFDSVDLNAHFISHAFFKNMYSNDLYFVGVKNGSNVDAEFLDNHSQYFNDWIEKHEYLSNAFDKIWDNTADEKIIAKSMAIIDAMGFDLLNPYIFENIVSQLIKLLPKKDLKSLFVKVLLLKFSYPNFKDLNYMYYLFADKLDDPAMRLHFAEEYNKASSTPLSCHALIVSLFLKKDFSTMFAVFEISKNIFMQECTSWIRSDVVAKIINSPMVSKLNFSDVDKILFSRFENLHELGIMAKYHLKRKEYDNAENVYTLIFSICDELPAELAWVKRDFETMPELYRPKKQL